MLTFDPNVQQTRLFFCEAMVRLSVFPVAFGCALLALAIGFVNRRKLFPEVEEIHRKRALESHHQAVEFKARVAEGVKRERGKRASD